jgi:hypothetical protein
VPINLDLSAIIAHGSAAFITILFAVIIFFFKRLVKQLDQVCMCNVESAHRFTMFETEMKRIPDLATNVEIMKNQFEIFKRDLSTALMTARHIKDLEKDFKMMEKNQDLVFSRVCELTTAVTSIQECLVKRKATHN